MALHGSPGGLLDGKHADGCDGTEYSSCRPVTLPRMETEERYMDPARRAAEIKVVLMEWCGDCGAADWEVV